MEICRKLDSIRASGFPEADGAAISGGATEVGAFSSSSGDANVSGPAPPRPRSEPLPECIPALAGFSGKERRPGTAASGRGTEAAGPLLRDEPQEEVGGTAMGSAPETETIANGGLGGEGGGESRGCGGSAAPSPRGRPKNVPSGSGSGEEGLALEPGANGSSGGGLVDAGPESDNIDGLFAEETGVPSVVEAKSARSRDQKAPSTRREKASIFYVKGTAGGVVLRIYQGANSFGVVLQGPRTGKFTLGGHLPSVEVVRCHWSKQSLRRGRRPAQPPCSSCSRPAQNSIPHWR